MRVRSVPTRSGVPSSTRGSFFRQNRNGHQFELRRRHRRPMTGKEQFLWPPWLRVKRSGRPMGDRGRCPPKVRRRGSCWEKGRRRHRRPVRGKEQSIRPPFPRLGRRRPPAGPDRGVPSMRRGSRRERRRRRRRRPLRGKEQSIWPPFSRLGRWRPPGGPDQGVPSIRRGSRRVRQHWSRGWHSVARVKLSKLREAVVSFLRGTAMSLSGPASRSTTFGA